MTITIIAKDLDQSYHCLLDGKKVHTLLPIEEVNIPLPSSTCQLTFKHARTKPLTVTSGDTIVVENAPLFRSLTSLTSILIFVSITFIIFSLDLLPQLSLTILPLLAVLPYLILPRLVISKR